ncbi:YkgJ family cysteine cluster protein [Oceanisphaera psychrotolerans]|uniref:Transposase n=1 Tax=Oceanisphaera psychrotolerans TaxID=1414654 RepID=A0A1J4QGY4_9GAMM|nr:YkgJ family cysteine cluster protein [Oceanisphaera psychrotolerans]OIN09675.1 transposase [Oceanisphaera psychrotolerans]
MSGGNPCLTCGACCAFFRVSFYWGEIHSDFMVPEALTEPVNPVRMAMQGTNQPKPRCVALEGEVGDCVSCSIYPNRPSPCRQFEANDAEGACNRARAAYGLPPLELEPVAA